MKRPFSKWSIAYIVFGLVAFVVNWMTSEIIEPVVLVGSIFLVLGVIFSFIAFLKNEKGVMKIISGVSFFLILLCLVLIEPLMFVYILTWLKNIF
ncbi:hypothetical protein [Sporosarcina ureae]|uniref:DUF4064 domain-containing protein n=1 Tax=Sporosarcina ureae TaxID=1571 RepID=A0ABM6JV20_SPOUR|nr:hypothetical protein [Sporosarcina ureae]ARF13995.1 hypothetical protein SporoS204_07460 [Sporosarcina ureae]